MSSTTRKAGTYYVILIAGVAALGGFLFGYDTAVIDGAVLALAKAFHTSSWLTGLAVSLALLGSAVGAFFAGRIADRYGRVKAMIVASVLFTLSAIGSGMAFSIWDFIGWRLLGGAGPDWRGLRALVCSWRQGSDRGWHGEFPG